MKAEISSVILSRYTPRLPLKQHTGLDTIKGTR